MKIHLLAHDAIFRVGKTSGLYSKIDGTAGDEQPRTRPMQKNDIAMHNDNSAW